MKNATHDRIRRLLPLLILVGLASPVSTVSAGVGVWSSGGPFGGDIRALAIDPANPATLYAGTGDGVLKSTDAGGTWANTGLPDLYVRVLAISPSNPSTLYTAGNNGVFKSTDSGASWAGPSTGLASTYVTTLAVDPTTPTTVYAGTSGGVFKSTDGGGSWTAVNTGLTDTNVWALAIDPANPVTLYVGTPGAGAFKSNNGGESWTTVNTGLVSTDVRALAIDPVTPATLYANTVNGGLNGGDGLYKSTNGGGSWTAVSRALTGRSVNGLAIDPSLPATLYAWTYGDGVFKSTNGGGSWSPINSGLTDSGVQALAIDPSAGATLYAGTLLGVFKSTNGGGSWTATNTGMKFSVTALAVGPSAPTTLYAGSYPNGSVFKSTDGGGSWTAIQTLYSKLQALAVDPSAPDTVYAGTSSDFYYEYPGFYKSTDGGANWTQSFGGYVFALGSVYALVIDPLAPATLYAGTRSYREGGGGIFKSTNGGATWAAANTGLTNLNVNALAIDPTAPAKLYAGSGGGVFRSTNSGGIWEAINTGLPSLYVNALALAPTGGTVTLYAGLEGGGVWQLTAPAASTITALLPTSAHSSGVNGAFYTTNVAVANTGALAASFTMKFLGNNQDGSNGPEKSFNLDPGKARTFFDVLGSEFHQTNNFGAIRITSNSSTLDIVSVTSTPGFGGTFGQAIPIIPFADLIPAGSARSILYIREGDGFRSNLILASGSSVTTEVFVALVSPAGETLATKTYPVPPNGMTQISRVVRDMGVSGPVTGARLVLSSSTTGASFTALASVIDETTNDPTAVLAQPLAVSGSAPYIWLLPASAHSSGLNLAFYTTKVAVANVGAAPASFTMKFLGNNQDGSGGPEQTFNLGSGKSVTYVDVLGWVFNQTSAFGAIRITSDTASLKIVSVTSTPGFGGTLSQTIPAVFSSDLISAGSSRSILYIREGDGFRSNLILASSSSVSTTVDAMLVSPEGATLAAKTYSVPPNGMTQISRVVRDMGVSGLVTGARLVLSSSTPNAAFTAFASVIDETTNDPTAVEAR